MKMMIILIDFLKDKTKENVPLKRIKSKSVFKGYIF